MVKLLVCHIAILNHMFDQREGSLREPEEEETAGVLEFKLLFVNCFINYRPKKENVICVLIFVLDSMLSLLFPLL